MIQRQPPKQSLPINPYMFVACDFPFRDSKSSVDPRSLLSIQRLKIFIISNIEMEVQADLLEVVGTGDPSGGMLGLAECRQQKRVQNGDDSDPYQEINQ